jgi:hypothetical protein
MSSSNESLSYFDDTNGSMATSYDADEDDVEGGTKMMDLWLRHDIYKNVLLKKITKTAF